MTGNEPVRVGEERDALRARLIAASGIFCFALAIRAGLLWQLSDSVLIEFVLGDAKNYVARGALSAEATR